MGPASVTSIGTSVKAPRSVAARIRALPRRFQAELLFVPALGDGGGELRALEGRGALEQRDQLGGRPGEAGQLDAALVGGEARQPHVGGQGLGNSRSTGSTCTLCVSK